MTKTNAAKFFYTNPNTGQGIPCTIVHDDEDGSFVIELPSGERGMVDAGELYCEDESGRYLGGPN